MKRFRLLFIILVFMLSSSVAETTPSTNFDLARGTANFMEDHYGITILIGDECAAIETEGFEIGSNPVGRTPLLNLLSYTDYEEEIECIDDCFSIYPGGFFTKFHCSEAENGLRILLPNRIMANGDTVAGVTTIHDGYYNIFLGVGAFNNLNVHHEIWHAMEYRITWDDPDAFAHWSDLNPEGFAYDEEYFQEDMVQYSDLLRDADLTVPVCKRYHKGVFQERNEWMVNHSNRVIAYFNGAPGGTKNTIDYAMSKGIEVITNNPDYKPKEKKRKKMEPEKIPYPENLLADIGFALIFENGIYTELNEDQRVGLSRAIKTLLPREQEMIQLRYEGHETLQALADRHELSRERVRQIISKGVRKLRHPSRTEFIRNGLDKAELAMKIACAEEIKKQLQIQRKRYPLMTEEDVVKFVFQGMLGVGHLITSIDDARKRLAAEMASLDPCESEPLIEKISTDWVRLNLRPAKAKGMSEDDLAWYLVRSVEWGSLSFSRQNVYNFCVKLDGSEAMKTAAEKVLDDNWLPSHSEQYREAYHPAYRVLYKDGALFLVLSGPRRTDIIR